MSGSNLAEQITPEEDLVDELLDNMMAQFSKQIAWWPLIKETFEPNNELPIPSVEHRTRISGPLAAKDPDAELFLKYGHANLTAYKNIYEAYSTKRFEDAHFLDWGVGCSRIFRHLPKEMQANAHGADVDSVNIEWNKENLPFGTFTQLYPSTPFPYEDNSFDLICGTSVFTHLDEEEQFFWLKELNRISRGYILLSIHGMLRASQVGWHNDREAIREWLKKGFINAKTPLPDIADVVGEDYYRSVAHTWKYIHDVWNDYVEVVDIVPGTISNQDAVVCRVKA